MIDGDRLFRFLYQTYVTHLELDVSILKLIRPADSRLWEKFPSKTGHDKRTIGMALLEALRHVIVSDEAKSVVLAGHDRGARFCHRLAIDADIRPLNFNVSGAILLDIVPTLVQWQSFSDSNASIGSFHWPLLANVDLATALIRSQGGDVWCRTCIERWAGKTQEGLQSLKKDNALDVYCYYMAQETVIRASCEDYRAGAEEDMILQKEDQHKGRKVSTHTLVTYSTNYLGSRYNIEVVWREWCQDPDKLITEAIEGQMGHFIAEEAPKETAKSMISFLRSLTE
jgi:pimeloyl-ACP methyl ester carboxylesterase